MSEKPIKEEVLTTSTLVMYELIQKIKRELPDTKYVYDEGLSYESAIKKFRDDQNMNAGDEIDGTGDSGTSEEDPASFALPLFAFRRSILRYAEAMGGIGRRSATKKATYPLHGDIANYVSATIIQAEFDIEFAYITREIQDMERFEVAYLSQKGFTDGEKLTIDFPELSETMQYQVDFKENLDDKTINVEENYFKTIVGKFTIRGYFLVFKGQVRRIESIGLRIQTYEKQLLDNILIQNNGA